MPNKLVSVIIPFLNEEESFGRLRSELTKLLAQFDTKYRVEIILIDDGSKDQTWKLILDFAAADPRVRGFSFSRNFGHQSALSFGYQISRGDAVITLDGDLQDPPEVILRMLESWEQGHDVVYAMRESREGETWFKLLTAKYFYRLLQAISDTKAPLDAGDFRLMSRASVDALVSMKERHRYLRGMVGWLGFKSQIIHYRRPPRQAGETKFTLFKMLKFASDALISFSTIPLRMFYFFAILCLVPFLGYLGYAVYCYIFRGEQLVPGWSSLILSVMAFGSLNLICLGIMGEYVGRIYEQSKERPLHIVATTTDLELGKARPQE